MGFETSTKSSSVQTVRDHEAIPMGFETIRQNGRYFASQDHEAIPMGFETIPSPASYAHRNIMKPSLWDLKHFLPKR